jgi:phospholipase/carboxylesterase
VVCAVRRRHPHDETDEIVKLDAAAVMWSAPERDRADRPLLVLLHGYGSHEGDLFGLSPHLPLGPVIASVRAPISLDGGWAWFDTTYGQHGDPNRDAANDAAQAVLDWLDGLEYTSVSLLGFSQGAAVAVQLLRLAPGRFTSAVALSGFVVGGAEPGDDDPRLASTPVFWGRGTRDAVIPAAAIARAADWLPTHTTLTERIYEDVAHAVSAAELSDVSAFLRASAR